MLRGSPQIVRAVSGSIYAAIRDEELPTNMFQPNDPSCRLIASTARR